MPITKSAKKALRQNRRRRVFNLRRLRTMRAAVKEIRTLIDEQKIDEAKAKLAKVYQALDKAAKRGVIKKNTASRRKSRLARAVAKASRTVEKNN